MQKIKRQFNNNYLKILEELKGVVLVANDQQEVDYLNPAGEMLLQTSLNRVKKRNLSSVIPLGPTLQAAVISAKEGSSTTIREKELLVAGGRNHICVDCTVSPLNIDELIFIVVELILTLMTVMERK